VAPPVPLARGVWDGRWHVEGPADAGLAIGALGAAGLAARPGWRTSGLTREALLAAPGLWREGQLAAAPLLDPGGRWRVRRIAPRPAPWEGGELR
jgi:tRNA(Ile)-lysidine synthase